MSSSVILFNKWVLDTLQFRMSDREAVRAKEPTLTETSFRLPRHPDHLPLDLLDHHDTIACSLHDDAGWAQDR